MRDKTLTLSIVIPAYNEAAHIQACLDSISRQIDPPDQIIVVDNNSTDSTAEIAQKYNSVSLIKESNQGLIPARNRGFDAANGKILCRIDADTILPPHWTRTVRQVLGSNEADAVTGPAQFQLIPFINYAPTIITRIYFWFALAHFRFPVLWGANMALKAEAWHEIKSLASTEDNAVHEDQDISLLLNLHGYTIAQLKQLTIRTDAERFWDARKLLFYYKKLWRTLRKKQRLGRKSEQPYQHQIHPLSAVLILCVTIPLALAGVLLSVPYKLMLHFKS